MSDQVQAGDVVQVKSGGPLMTIEYSFQTDGGRTKVMCTWFDGNKRISESFYPVTLEKR